MQLADARLLLTGATGGLGEALADELARRGARLVLSARSSERLDVLRDRLPGEHATVRNDLEQPDAPETLLERAGPLDGLVFAAGLPASGWLDEYEAGQLSRAVRVNLEAPMQVARALLPSLRERRHGHLCFVSSLAGKVPSPGLSIYVATKFGLRGFALALASELRGSGVECSVVLPGFIGDAGMLADSGARTPAAVGSSSARDAAERICDGIAAGRAETVIAPRRHRVLAHAMSSAPRPFMPALSGREAVRTAREIAAGQRDRR
jgi:short-subunit dehydrogenase